jgi:hypothetical protein
MLSVALAADLVPDRIARGAYVWAAFWAVVAAIHIYVIFDVVRIERAALSSEPKE